MLRRLTRPGTKQLHTVPLPYGTTHDTVLVIASSAAAAAAAAIRMFFILVCLPHSLSLSLSLRLLTHLFRHPYLAL